MRVRYAPKILLRGARIKLLGSMELGIKLKRLGAQVSSTRGVGTARFMGLEVEYTDPLVFYMELKDIFFHKIYHLESSKQRPRILDCGSHIGMSILYQKRCHPSADITGFEPDPIVFPVLENNLRRNGISDVQLVQAALTSSNGEVPFVVDNRDGSHVASIENVNAISVPTIRLSRYLDESVDLLKMNIEGQELDVLREVGDRLSSVGELVIEYHAEPGKDQSLHTLLGLLDDHGFRYLIHDFDAESVAATKPPFNLSKDSRFVLLVYAKRLG